MNKIISGIVGSLFIVLVLFAFLSAGVLINSFVFLCAWDRVIIYAFPEIPQLSVAQGIAIVLFFYVLLTIQMGWSNEEKDLSKFVDNVGTTYVLIPFVNLLTVCAIEIVVKVLF